MSPEVFVVPSLRSPFARMDRELQDFDSLQLSLPVVQQSVLGGHGPGPEGRTGVDLFVWGAVIPSLAISNWGREVWLDSGLDHSIFTAWGFAGQFVFCVPSLNLVVATASDGNVGWNEANVQEEQVLDLILERVLPAVIERQVIPQPAPGAVIGDRAGRTGILGGVTH